MHFCWRICGILVLLSIVVARKISDLETGDSKCPQISECPFNSESCQDDDDCGPSSVCCNSTCGKVCTKQLYTGCQTLRQAASRRAKALGVDRKSIRMPRCTKAGAFEPVQCDNEIISSCWCVDESGFELPGTRAPAAGLVNCTDPKPCAAHTCRMFCPHGFSLASDGCPLCKCRDPCDDIKCPDKLACHLEDLACSDPPCPPVPTCKKGRSLDNICPVGDPLRISDTVRPFLCGNDPTKPSCPPLYQCLVQTGSKSDDREKEFRPFVLNAFYAECTVHFCQLSVAPMHRLLLSGSGRNANVRTSQKLLWARLIQSEYQIFVPFAEQVARILFTGNDYGVCCPASLKIQKTGTCPAETDKVYECGMMCTHDLECPSVQKCCSTQQCGSSCVHPKNVTECLHQKTLSELLAVSERAGRGYVPQCSEDGQFEPRQCSRNALVCWCVDRMGRKLKGSMGAADGVNCSLADARSQSLGRSITGNGIQCEPLECAAVCEYGFKLDEDGCPTCKCDDPCAGYTCPEDEECVTVRDSSCVDILCPTLPVCRPKAVYTNPCVEGTPLTDDPTGNPIACAVNPEDGVVCPNSHKCTPVPGSTQAVCCPVYPEIEEETTENENEMEFTRSQTMCEYLHGFAESMEGTRDDMMMALPQPSCDEEGNFEPTQCDNKTGDCWCADHFGTEIPRTRGKSNTTKNCEELRETLDCLDLTCRMGCDYGFVLDEDTGCPSCQCRDPCTSINCGEDEHCQLVEVSCKDHYCAPVPACLPKKIGQCPYIVPATSTSCDFECNSDLACNGTLRCCSNGCGTQCTEPLLLTACQHQHSLLTHQSHESGKPPGRMYIPQCKEDGRFESKQCNPGTQECWCVDFRGFEVSQTRKPSSEPLNCDEPPKNNCPLFNCLQDCDHGFELDENGCRRCTCINPCLQLACREDGEVCRLVNVECIEWPCPPVAMCLPQKENPCLTGEPLKLGNSDETISCGPDYDSCPSSHKCQLSPLGEYAVCCPKPRDVCFEPVDSGYCIDSEMEINSTRYYFNPRSNKCESFLYSGCQGNHNNFHSEKMCNVVCPVLSQCERLREKNQRQAERYHKPTFTPRCEPNSGNWEPVQCLQHVGVCWCVNPQGEPLKGTLTRGMQPECNFRQARNRARDRSDAVEDADLVLEELMMQIGSFDDDESPNDDWELPLRSRCEAQGAQCDNDGKFLPAQCDDVENCWCVDEAGNQLPNTNTFKRGEQLCLPTPVESVEVTLGFRGEYDDVSAVPVVNQVSKIIKNLRGSVSEDGVMSEATDDVLYVQFALVGSNKVDVAYRLEQMVMQQRLPGMTADITRSRFTHKLGSSEPMMAERVVALEHREIISQSPVSLVAHYHTALIVIAAASAFVISVLTLLVILYKRKMAVINSTPNKMVDNNQRFLSLNRPIYIELPNEKSPVQTEVKPPES